VTSRLARFVLTTLTVTALLAFSGIAAAAGLRVDGSLPRDLTTGKFRMTVTIYNVTQAQRDAGAAAAPANAEDELAKRFSIKFPTMDSSAVPTNKDLATQGVLKLYVQQYQSPLTAQAEANTNPQTYSYTYYLEFIETQSGYLATQITGGTLTTKIAFYLGDQNTPVVPDDETYTLNQSAYVIAAAPSFDPTSAIMGSHKSLTVHWNVQTQVPALGSSSAQAPSSVNVYVVDKDLATSQPLPSMKFSGTTSPDTDVTGSGGCTFTPPDSDGAACVTCPDGVYLNESATASLPGFIVRNAVNSSGALSVTGLENNHPYTVFLQYEPDGTKVSQCLTGLPTPNFSMTELNGAGDAKVVDFRCFIATAAYGSAMAPDLRYFRKFRDEVLLKNAAGKTFVHYYYKYSPPLAHYIAAHPWLRTATRDVLSVPADILRAVDAYY